MFLKISQNLQENICAKVSFLIRLQAEAFNFIKKRNLSRLFFCEFREIFRNTFFFSEYLWATASNYINDKSNVNIT